MEKKKAHRSLVILLLIAISFSNLQCKKKEEAKPIDLSKCLALTSSSVDYFYSKYPELAVYKKQVVSMYEDNKYDFVWYDNEGLKEKAEVIYDKINNFHEEGVQAKFPYKKTLDNLLENDQCPLNAEVELFLSSYYFLYVDKTLKGIPNSKSKELGWYLPRKKQSYVGYLDSILVDPKLIDKKTQNIEQYYKLKTVLKQYREISRKGGWKAIDTPTDFKSIKPGDSSAVVAQIRTRLFLTGDIATDSKSGIYEQSLQQAVMKYKKRNGFSLDKIILKKHIDEMNVPIDKRIRTIIVNMERCRWIPTELTEAKEYIVVNIPSYRLQYYKKGRIALTSNVVVGKPMNRTVIFSGNMSYIVFSPYWNVPKSIKEKEILPAIEKNSNYLAENNMEWEGENIRQRPGKDNSLGLVKFLFPNNNNIYLHDTPAKELFNAEKRAFSHGCIRVEKPRELAIRILENDANWTPQKIDEAMNKGEESWYTLKKKIPVYIGYFTAFVDEEGNINFYKDIYEKDARLAAMLVEE
ncbi:MAG: L,D-transpeptidase family protein [Bacteroidota bacterium]